jgi:hypothetical protein
MKARNKETAKSAPEIVKQLEDVLKENEADQLDLKFKSVGPCEYSYEKFKTF